MRKPSWRGDKEHMKIFFSSSTRVIKVTLKMESVAQFQESSTQDANCRANIISATETVLRPDDASFKMQTSLHPL